MHVAVLGAGVIGVSTAYYLTLAGHSVTVIDREAQVANATSCANGSQLCYSFTDAMASPAFAWKIPALLAGADPAICIRPSLDTGFLRWSGAFLRQCTAAKAARNTVDLLRLALRSADLLATLQRTVDIEFSFRRAGKLVLLRTAREMADAVRACSLKAGHGCETRVIGLSEAIEIEPGVRRMAGEYAGAVYSPDDSVGDARRFTESLAEHLRKSQRCTFELDTPISGIACEKRKMRGVRTDRGAIDADAVVVCLGPWSPALLKPLGIDPGICPARGYSVTLPPGEHSPSVSVTDLGKRFVVSRIAAGVRIAGFADFVGFDTRRDPRRIRDLLNTARQYAPAAADYDAPANHPWGGFRPITASGRPKIGGTSIDGLYLNTGHGSLGWTLACVSGYDVARLLTGSSMPDESLAA